MNTVTLDKIASVTKNIGLSNDVTLSDKIIPEAGHVVVGRIHGVKTAYNQLENCDGRFVQIHRGDIVAGVLGHRNALRGYSGKVPELIAVGDTLQVLNLGGVVGKHTSGNPKVGKPFDFEVLGSVLLEKADGDKEHAHIQKHSVSPLSDEEPSTPIPIIYVAGTCMQAGKTSAATSIIRGLRDKNIKVGACKLTGVSLLRDTLEMLDYGATHALSFMDDGIVTTSSVNAADSARRVIHTLMRKDVEVIVAELGDGILGSYGVKEILADAQLLNYATTFILCANDPVGAWGGVEILKHTYQVTPDVICGPTTDNLAGVKYIEEELGIKAINARVSSKALTESVCIDLNKCKK